jgi:hypothetical protein
MQNSSLLLLIIPLHRSNNSIITGKIFEYIASSVPILCLGPASGDAAHIIRAVGSGATFNYYESDSIFDFLMQPASQQSQIRKDKKLNYSRQKLTKRLSEILNS